MRTRIQNLFVLPALMSCCCFAPAGRLAAQTFTTLHSFADGSDGANPYAGLILSGTTLYGTALNGGSSNVGTVFRVNTDGTNFTNLHSFTKTSVWSSPYTNSDGASPAANLILSGNTLYGTAGHGGGSGSGTVFALNADGTGFSNLHSFAPSSDPSPFSYGTNSDGFWPFGALILSGNTLYGTTYGGGSSGNGTVFAVNTDGSGFQTLHSFTAISGPTAGSGSTNADGAYPYAGLILSGNTLYGTADWGGSLGNGTVFALNTNGSSFTTLHSFAYVSDGALPNSLILSGNTLYGSAFAGGSSGNGTVFKVNTDGGGFANLHNFAAFHTNSSGVHTNSDGLLPDAGLILSGNTLYGTAYGGGTLGEGTVFAVNTDGTGFTPLHNFAGDSDGAYPESSLILSGNTLYGTATRGGSSGKGTIFSISLESLGSLRLTITYSGTNAILTWPTNYAEVVIQGDQYEAYFLQSTTGLVSPVVWTAVYPMPVVINGQLVVTNAIDNTQRFYRIVKGTGPLSDLPCLWSGPNPCPCMFQCVSGVWTAHANCRNCGGW